MAINIEHTFKTCAHVHYFPGNLFFLYDPQTLDDLAETVTKTMVKHNFDQVLAFDMEGHSLMIVTQT